MSHIIHRNLRAVPPTAVSASGIEIVDRDGRRYIDASGGAAVSCLGHAHPPVLAAMHAQVDRIAYAHTSFFTTDASETLADTLADLANATNWALTHLGCPTHSPEKYRHMVGDGARQLCSRYELVDTRLLRRHVESKPDPDQERQYQQGSGADDCC